MKNILSVRFEPEVLERLSKLAVERKKTVGHLIRAFVDDGLRFVQEVPLRRIIDSSKDLS